MAVIVLVNGIFFVQDISMIDHATVFSLESEFCIFCDIQSRILFKFALCSSN